jgi:hypothetical protein
MTKLIPLLEDLEIDLRAMMKMTDRNISSKRYYHLQGFTLRFLVILLLLHLYKPRIKTRNLQLKKEFVLAKE